LWDTRCREAEKRDGYHTQGSRFSNVAFDLVKKMPNLDPSINRMIENVLKSATDGHKSRPHSEERLQFVNLVHFVVQQAYVAEYIRVTSNYKLRKWLVSKNGYAVTPGEGFLVPCPVNEDPQDWFDKIESSMRASRVEEFEPELMEGAGLERLITSRALRLYFIECLPTHLSEHVWRSFGAPALLDETWVGSKGSSHDMSEILTVASDFYKLTLASEKNAAVQPGDSALRWSSHVARWKASFLHPGGKKYANRAPVADLGAVDGGGPDEAGSDGLVPPPLGGGGESRVNQRPKARSHHEKKRRDKAIGVNSECMALTHDHALGFANEADTGLEDPKTAALKAAVDNGVFGGKCDSNPELFAISQYGMGGFQHLREKIEAAGQAPISLQNLPVFQEPKTKAPCTNRHCGWWSTSLVNGLKDGNGKSLSATEKAARIKRHQDSHYVEGCVFENAKFCKLIPSHSDDVQQQKALMQLRRDVFYSIGTLLMDHPHGGANYDELLKQCPELAGNGRYRGTDREFVPKPRLRCNNCGDNHATSACSFDGQVCWRCKKPGHRSTECSQPRK
ncbi:hypothetical protein N8602_00195, partial [bacterium]|nr:hypothetical protein [bacterium]